MKGDKKYNPEPDVTVIDTAVALGQIYVERFCLVAEVLSESDMKTVLARKLRYYRAHEHNRCILFVHQDRVGADQHNRKARGGWSMKTLSRATTALAFPDIGTIGRLGDLYRLTPLDPFAKTPTAP